jgi:DNA helicase-2/ATP-dependent DNA helicase PcrA
MADGIFPDYRARTTAELQEEARRAFVAVNPSRRLLYFSYPQSKIMPWGDARLQKPSDFLRRIVFRV